MDKPLRGPALNEAIRDYVKQYIFDHGLNGGDPLPPEAQLAQDLGVGRSSIREAVKSLQSLGIVEARSGTGIYVREYNLDPVLESLSYGIRFNSNTLAEFTQIRIWIEAAIVEEAVKQISNKEIAQLEMIIESWKERVQAGEPDSDLDEQFHRTLYQTLHNSTLIKFIDVFWIAFKNLDTKAIQTSDPVVELEPHQALLEAVKARDAALTRQRLVQHFNPLQERIQKVVMQDKDTR